jgi:hypothetical protein
VIAPQHPDPSARAPRSHRQFPIRLFPTAILLAFAMMALLLVAPALAQDETPPASDPNIWLIVETGGGQSLVRPLTVTLPISGLAALQSSGLDVTVAETDFGPAVCAIQGVGCPAEDCFCNANEFWNYSYWDGAVWVSYPVGAASSVITQTGALEGWRWGSFEGAQALSPAEAAAATAALEWLAAQQEVDGGYGSMGGAVESLFALGANDLAARDWQHASATRSLEQYSRFNQARFARSDVAAPGKLAVALASADACLSRGTVRPSATFDEATAAYAPSSGGHAWGILGTLASSEALPPGAVETLLAAQDAGGGWEWQPGFGPDSNTTSLAVQALAAAGEPLTSTAIISGLAYLRSTQQPDGGFAYDAVSGTGSDANSTSYAIQGLVAAGEDPAGAAWSVEGATPVDFLLSLQTEDGALEWQPGSGANAFATQQAVAALLRRPFPMAERPLERCRAQ